MIEPEADHVQHLLLHGRTIVIQVRLVVEEPVPVVGATTGIPGPVGRFIVDKDDPHVRVALVRVTPDVPVSIALVRGMLGFREALNQAILVGRMVWDHVGDHAQVPPVGFGDQGAESSTVP